MIFVYSTFSSKKEAAEISKKLIKNGLIACANIFPIDSMYLWKKKIIQEKEFSVFLKTKKANFKKVEKFILENHSYDVSCILEIPINRITKKYRKWLNNILTI